jgi:hypothetical protein
MIDGESIHDMIEKTIYLRIEGIAIKLLC